MKSTYLLSAEAKTGAGQLLNYAVLEAKPSSTRLITTGLKGTALGGLSLVLFSSIYYLALAAPFLFFRVPPVTQWGAVVFTAFVIGVPAGFILIIFQGFSIFRRIEVKYPKAVRSIKVLEARAGSFSHELVVQSDGERLVLTIKSSRKNLLGAMALGGP